MTSMDFNKLIKAYNLLQAAGIKLPISGCSPISIGMEDGIMLQGGAIDSRAHNLIIENHNEGNSKRNPNDLELQDSSEEQHMVQNTTTNYVVSENVEGIHL